MTSAQNLSVAIQMDPVETIAIVGDTSFAFGLEAQRRGHSLWYYTPDRLSLNDAQIEARGQSLQLFDNPDDHFKVAALETRPLSDFDVILMRQDPPFDMDYINTTYLLELAEAEGLLVVNRAQSLRDANEKLFTA